ncbi:VWA domain-containing protein [Streptomyces sp. T-3]|nr:VWA domain-containing protein [Streptomyces sp. T-3]
MNRSGIGRTAAVLAAAAALTLTGLAPAAHADETSKPVGSRIETIIDASGSMKESVGGRSKMAAAKQAVNQLIDRLPSQAPMGLRVYGATYGGKDKTTGCKDTQLLAPVAEMDAAAKSEAKRQINSLDGVGFTPIGDTLRTAAADLGSEGERRIILVSDGEDTCAPPDPCEVARELKAQGVDLVIDTLGFRVDAKAERQLRCIAKVTDGQYDGVGDADDLADGLQDAFKRAWTPYELSGTKTTGGESCTHATLLVPGQYTDHVTYLTDRWYKVSVRPGQALRFSASAVPRSAYKTSAAVQLEMYLPGRPTTWEHEVSVTQNWSDLISVGTESDRLTWNDLPPDAASGDICIKVHSLINSTKKTEPVELAVALAHQAVGADGKPAAEREAPDTGGDLEPQAQHSVALPVPALIGAAGATLLAMAGIRYSLNRRSEGRS